MNGQMTYSETDNIIKDFIRRCDPYTPTRMPKFDLRGYTQYLEEHGIDGFHVTKEIMDMFKCE